MHDINRYFYLELNKWANSVHRKPLLVRGARQVGKSYAIRNWAKNHFKGGVYCEINFEERADLGVLFEQNLDIERIVDAINLSFGVNLRTEKSFLFLDEIQIVPKAITALRYFYEKFPKLHVIAAGSLLDFVLKEISFPVGRIDSLFMKPIGFFEFLEAIQKKHLVDHLNNLDLTKKVQENIHNELLLDLKKYFYIGGMPEAISIYLETKDLSQVSKVHGSLLRSYQDDFAKYAKKADWSLLQHVFEILPNFVATSKVVYSKFGNAYRIEKIKVALQLLESAHLVSRVFSSYARQIPLAAGVQHKFYKLLFLDIGLLQHALGFDWQIISPDTPLNNLCNGKFAEQFVGQEILACKTRAEKSQLHYWHRNEKGSDAELDFLLEYHSGIAAVEVKSGNSGSLKSLHLYRKEFAPSQSFVLSQRNIEKSDGISYLPLYLAGRLA